MVEVPRAGSMPELAGKAEAEPSREIKKRVDAARARQRERLAGTGADCNAHMGPRELEAGCALSPECSAAHGERLPRDGPHRAQLRP
ncbi:MAG: hypothetical protein ACLTSG_12445 [Lachnospiraceae bacterium]